MKYLFKYNETKTRMPGQEDPRLSEDIYTYLRSLNSGGYQVYIIEGYFNKDNHHSFLREDELDRLNPDRVGIKEGFISNPAINCIIRKNDIIDDECFYAQDFHYFEDIFLLEKFLSFLMNVTQELESMNMIVNYTIISPDQFRLLIRGK